MGQGQEGLEPGVLALAKEFHILKAFTPGEEGAYGNDQNIEQVMFLRPLNTRVL